MDAHTTKAPAKRRYAPKTRTGCHTCKARRVKCDETWPICQRCIASFRKCAGYRNTTSAILNPQPSHLSILGDQSTREVFEFFVVETVPCLSGFFQDEMWKKDVLQQSHSDPIVRHAINALGALHRKNYLQRTISNYENTCDVRSVEMMDYPVIEYTAAVKGLRERIEKGHVSLPVVLMCTVLFTHFESLRGSYLSGMMHKEKSMEMLKQALQSQEKNIESSLINTLSQLDLQASFLHCSYMPVLLTSDATSLDKPLSTPADANILVVRWTRRFFRFLRTSVYEQKLGSHIPESPNPRLTSLAFVDAFETINLLLQEYMRHSKTKLSPHEHNGLILLQVRTKMNLILAETCSSDETRYDDFTTEFENILTSLEHVMSTSSLQKIIFSATFDEGILNPLDFVASKCRNHGIRCRALDLMKQFPSQGGMWHVSAMTKIVERIIKFEECEAGFVGEKRKRVLNDHVLSLNPTDPGSGMVVKFLVWPVGEDEVTADFEEELKW